MPSVPDAGDVTGETKDSLADGIVYAVGTGVGQTFGGLGHAVGGVVAGASIGGQTGETLSTLAVATGVRSAFMGGGGGGQRRARK